MRLPGERATYDHGKFSRSGEEVRARFEGRLHQRPQIQGL